jgi:hypothetical protein
MPDPTRTDPSRGYRTNTAAYDQRRSARSGDEANQRASSKAHDFVRSRTREERQGQQQGNRVERLQRIKKGANGVQVFKENVIAADPNEVQPTRPSVPLVWVKALYFANGALETAEAPMRNAVPL